MFIKFDSGTIYDTDFTATCAPERFTITYFQFIYELFKSFSKVHTDKKKNPIPNLFLFSKMFHGKTTRAALKKFLFDNFNVNAYEKYEILL